MPLPEETIRSLAETFARALTREIRIVHAVLAEIGVPEEQRNSEASRVVAASLELIRQAALLEGDAGTA